MNSADAKLIVEQHEQILAERAYPPEIVAELRYYRAKFIPQRIRIEIGHEEPRKPKCLTSF